MQMQTLKLSFGTWRRCLVGRNPLVRNSDRREARALLLVVVSSLIAAPLACAAGSDVYDGRVETFAAQRLTRHEILATVTANSTPANVGYSKYQVTPVQWKVGDKVRTDGLLTPYTVKAGDRQTIWLDADGNRVSTPLLDEDATTEAVAVAFASWLIVTCGGAAGWAMSRSRLNRSRHAGWDEALENLAGDGRTNRDI